MEKEKENKIYVKGSTLYYECKGEVFFELELENVKLIGEYTNDQGPFFDDWFLVFVDVQNRSFKVSMYSENIENTIDEIVKFFQFERTLSLVNSADWKSVILWPERMKGKEFLQLIQVKPTTFLGKIGAIFGLKRTGLDVTDEVKEFLKT